MSNKILLIDEIVYGINDKSIAPGGGHHRIYMSTLSAIENTYPYDNCVTFPSIKKKPISGYMVRKAYFQGLPHADIACFLYFDSIYMVPTAFHRIRGKFKATVAVLHWFPTNTYQQYLLKKSSGYFDFIIVHSEYTKLQMLEIGIRNVIVIDYPCFCHVDVDKIEVNTNNTKKKFVCLGAGRRDKGYDILAQSFSYITDEVKSKIMFIIAGKQKEISYVKIQEMADKNGIDIDINDSVLSDEQYWEYVVNSDVVLLPYRRIFSGNSGPMTDGIASNKYILGPDEGNIGYLINKYNLGSTFKIENPVDLAREISHVANIDTHCDHEYRKSLSVTHFLNEYKSLFDSLL